MRELDAILQAWRALEAGNSDAVLATVVHVTGSAYRRPGGRMLIVPGGQRIGCVSGGCLEGEIVKKAWWFTESGRAVVRTYDTSSEDGAVWEFGLGCDGVVHVMLERVNSASASAALEFIDAHGKARKPAVVVSVIRTPESGGIRIGDRLLVDDSFVPSGDLCGSRIESEAMLHATAALREKESRLAHLGDIAVFAEWIGPPVSLAVFGAGHDAIPLSNFAAQVGWDVAVADGRPAYARPDRFPAAGHVMLLQAADPLRGLEIDCESAVVMMTHNYALDLMLLPRVLSRRPRYLGLLGPRKRAERLFADLQLSEPAFVHAPAGLDAGSGCPEAIALSIVAEIQAVINSRPGGKLRDRRDPIHDSAYEVGRDSSWQAPDSVRPSWCETSAGYHV